MRIVKSIPHPINEDNNVEELYFGLGDDGEVYYQYIDYGWQLCTGKLEPDRWASLAELDFTLSMKEMKYIVKEFGHLLVFL